MEKQSGKPAEWWRVRSRTYLMGWSCSLEENDRSKRIFFLFG
jgi:hypothetical protein